MLANQIRQVGMTYLTQPYVWWGIALIALMVGPQALIVFSPNRSPAEAAQPMMMVLGMPMLFVLPFLVGHVKAQFAHARARLMPHFLRAHVIVLAGILLAVFLLIPLMLAQICGLSPLGFIALAMAIGVPAIWGSQFNRFVPLLISLAAFYSLLTNLGLRWWILEADSHRVAHTLVAFVGAALVIGWVWRVSHITEEMADYQNIYQLLLARRSGTEAVEQRRLLATQVGRNRLQAWIGDLWHSRLSGHRGDSRTSRSWLLRYGFAAVPPEVQACSMAAMFVGLGLFLNRFSYLAKEGANFGAMFFFIQFAVLMPGQMAGEMLAQRRPRLALEMLLPMSRRQFIDSLLAASVGNSLVLWFMMNAAIGLVYVLVSDVIALDTAAMFLLLSAATMFVSVALGLRLAIWPSRAKRYAVIMPTWFPISAPLVVWAMVHAKTGESPFILVAIVLAAIGAVLMMAARRAWLNLELG